MRTLTKEMQSKITPSLALKLLRDGNERFVKNLKVNRNLLQQVNDTKEGQHPFAVILSCIDSRTSTELVFDQGLGDIFSVRIAGNILNEDILGSMEFACKIAGAKIIVVLGHTKCGAIKGACDHVELGHLTGLLSKIRPVMDRTPYVNGTPYAYPDAVAAKNVHSVMDDIAKRSMIIGKMVESHEIAIVGGMYDVETGIVEFFEHPHLM
ncbi:MAG: carbonic anhydrase family protein [Saprospiraceae bacterium]|nr:carbonic anhydrase family protein [Saprospiraceae bacterium]